MEKITSRAVALSSDRYPVKRWRSRPAPFEDLAKVRRELDSEEIAQCAVILREEEKQLQLRLNTLDEQSKKPPSFAVAKENFGDINRKLCVKICYMNLIRILQQSPAKKKRFRSLVENGQRQQLTLQINKIFWRLSSWQHNFKDLKTAVSDKFVQEIRQILEDDILKFKENLKINVPLPELGPAKLEQLFRNYKEIKDKIQNFNNTPVESEANSSPRTGVFRLLTKEQTRQKVRELRSENFRVESRSATVLRLRKVVKKERGSESALRALEGELAKIEQEISQSLDKLITEKSYLSDGLSSYMQILLKHNFKTDYQFLQKLEKSTVNFIRKKALLNIEIERTEAERGKVEAYRKFRLNELQQEHLAVLHEFYQRTFNAEVIEHNLWAAYGNAKHGLQLLHNFFSQYCKGKDRDL